MHKEKNVLVTGADGFIGSHLVEYLVRSGFNVTALCHYNSMGALGWLEHINPEIKKNVEFHLGDIRDRSTIRALLVGKDIVYNLAALIAIPYSYSATESYIDTNIRGTFNLLEEAKFSNIEKFIQTSTSEVYGTAKYVPIDEDHPLNAQSPYAASKIGSDQLAMSFYASFEVPVTVFRPFNTYGPRQSARAVIPTIITQLLSGLNKIKLGDVNTTRDFNYVLDTVRGFHEIGISENTTGEVINCGSNFEISIKETFDLITKIMSVDAEIVTDQSRLRPQKSEVERLWCDNRKLLKITNFKPSVSIEDGLLNTINWFSKDGNRAFYKEFKYNV